MAATIDEIKQKLQQLRELGNISGIPSVEEIFTEIPELENAIIEGITTGKFDPTEFGLTNNKTVAEQIRDITKKQKDIFMYSEGFKLLREAKATGDR